MHTASAQSAAPQQQGTRIGTRMGPTLAARRSERLAHKDSASTRTLTRRSLCRATSIAFTSRTHKTRAASSTKAHSRPRVGGARTSQLTRTVSATLRPTSSQMSSIDCRLGSSSHQPEMDEMEAIKLASRTHLWHWDEKDKSRECIIISKDQLEVCFHPQCSESAAAIRGSEPLIKNGNYYYWELTAYDKTYGTSVMFGLCTKEQRLHADDYCNLIGLDKNGWSLSHKGFIWHSGKHSQYTQVFPTNQTVTIGLLYNTMRGELSYFMGGKNLGVAFHGLNNVNSELYPVIGSTAKCTRIRLTGAYCGYVSLLERSCYTLLKISTPKEKLINYLHQQKAPMYLIRYLAEQADVCCSQTENTAHNRQYNWNVK